MTRKLFTLLLCLLLALALPLSSLAATEYTFSIVPGDELRTQEAVADLLDCVALRLVTDEDSGALLLGLLMNDEEMLNAALRVDESGVYSSSQILGEKPVYLSWDDVFTLIANLAQTSDVNLTADEQAALEASLTAAKEQVVAVISGKQALKTADVDPLASFQEMYKDDPAMLAYIEDIQARTVITDGEFVDAAHDAATQKAELTITQEDFVKMCDTEYMKSILKSSFDSYAASQTGETSMTFDEFLAEVKKLYSEADINIPITTLTADEGETLVSVSMPATIKMMDTTTTESGETTEEPAEIDMPMQYNRLTTEAGITHKGEISMSVNGEQQLDMVLDALGGADGAISGMMAMLVENQQLTLTFDKSITNAAADYNVSVYMRADAAAILAPAAADRPMIGFNVKRQEVDAPAALAALQASTIEGSIELPKLTQTEMEEFLTGISTNAMSALFNIMGALPSSVLELMTSIQTPAN